MSKDPIPPYTFHLCFPWLGWEYEYLLRRCRYHMGEKSETGFVLDPIGENRSDFHQRLMASNLKIAKHRVDRWESHVPYELPLMARLLIEDINGRIVAINDPELPPSPPDPDRIPD